MLPPKKYTPIKLSSPTPSLSLSIHHPKIATVSFKPSIIMLLHFLSYSSLLPLFLTFILLLLLHPPPHSAAQHHHHHHRRRVLHPIFSSTPTSSAVPPTEPPSPSPLHHPSYHSVTKLPFTPSSASAPPPASSTTTDNGALPFFPTDSSPPPPPTPPLPPTPTVTTIPTFPANVSSLALPSSSSSSHSHSSNKLVVLSVAAVALVLCFFAFIIIIRRKNGRKSSELRPLYPHDTPTSDGRPPPKLPNNHVSQTSSEFLYLGTVTEANEFQVRPTMSVEGTSSLPEVEERVYHLKLCGGSSPELKPLPPLPKHSGSFQLSRSAEQNTNNFRPLEEEEGVSEATASRGEELEFEFFSPSNSSRHDFDCEGEDENDDYFNNSGLKSCFSSSYHGSPCNNTDSPGRDSDVSVEIQALAEKAEFFPAPAPPAPPHPHGVRSNVGPPPFVPPSGPVVLKRSGPLSKSGERNEEGGGGGGGGMKPKLKALYWDKVRASSDRVTVWDQLHPGSFKLNEEMIETLFTAKDGARRSIMPMLNEEYRVLDPKKSQNIAILLKALSVTEKEVCEALLQGNVDSLGTELLESLLKMAPTKEEERKLLEYNDASPMKLGSAEKFLRAVLDVPFAFKRVDGMLYMATFDSEVEYLRKAFETLEAACEQLRNSRMFLKLIEAVLKTGNRMNVGTNRGDAQAFKLDTLLKLVDIKGRDGKTTLLHFVVQEIIKAESSRRGPDSKAGFDNRPVIHDEIELRKRGLEVVASLGGELMNVKKAAAMDSNALSTDVTKLARGIIKINEVLKLNEENQMMETNKRFAESMIVFLKKSETEIVKIQSQESSAYAQVKELTEYFHGNLSKEEAHPFRIFMVVRDFLGVLDQVCKEVGKVNERTTISSIRQFPLSVNPALQPPFPEFSTTTDADNPSDNDNLVHA